MDASAAALFLVPMIGVRTLDPNWDGNDANQPGLVPGDLEMVALAETQALQDIFGNGPSSISEQRFTDVVLRAPKSVSFTATQFSKTIANFVGWEDWMTHCTVQGGDGEDNELFSATELARPYMAGTAPVTATVYHDATVLPSWVKNTIDPVSCGLNPHLDCASNRDEFRAWSTTYQGSQRPRPEVAYNIATFTKSAGTPSIYLVEPRYSDAGPLELIMRFNPMPAQVTALAFKVKRKPPVITVANIMPPGLTVTGTLVLDATGNYRLMGSMNTNVGDAGNVYVRDSSLDLAELFVIANASGAEGSWSIRNIGGDLRWIGPTGPSPVGTYVADGDNTGTATVTQSTAATPLPIPTDWHETIFVPFARKYFMAHPSFNNKPLAAAIMDQYNTAKLLLDSFKPRIAPTAAAYC